MCTNCAKRGLRFCIYAEKLEAVPQVLVEVMNLLKSLPDERAFELLRILRENDDPATVLSTFRGDREGGGGAHPQPDQETEAPPVSRNTLESELMAKNPVSYPPLLPIIPSVLAESNLLRPLGKSSQ